MNPQAKKAYLKPEDVQPAKAKRVLAFLNAAKTAEEIADAIEFPGERDVGIKIAQNILDKRAELGGFEDLKQVDDVPQVGPARFTQIVDALEARKEVKTVEKKELIALVAQRAGISETAAESAVDQVIVELVSPRLLAAATRPGGEIGILDNGCNDCRMARLAELRAP